MGDMGEYFRDWREHKRERKETGRAMALRILEESGIAFETLSENGPHLRFAEGFDFWPSTGNWIHRETQLRGFGVRSLLREIKKVREL